VSESRDLKLLSSGKVRELYDLGESALLVTSDRISTYDVIHPNVVPDKGKVLTGLSTYWFKNTSDIIPNHLLATTEDVPQELLGRALKVKKLKMLPVEFVVRGYLSGSGWQDYQQEGSVCGVKLPDDLIESQQLPEPILTPATKAEFGEHDENISMNSATEIVGDTQLVDLAGKAAIALYKRAAAHAYSRGLILADTKFEFGIDEAGQLTLGDEALTPDSSRYWSLASYKPGQSQPSFDKQYVRDWARGTGWDRNPPAPKLPGEVVQQTRSRYISAYEQITGSQFSDWLERTEV